MLNKIHIWQDNALLLGVFLRETVIDRETVVLRYYFCREKVTKFYHILYSLEFWLDYYPDTYQYNWVCGLYS